MTNKNKHEKIISAFIYVTVDGFFAGPRGEINWFKSIKHDEGYYSYTHVQASSDHILLFGRTTYDMMKSYWPTLEAMENDPVMAEAVNNNTKIVFSKTLQSVEEGPDWKNIRLFKDINPAEIIRLKEKEGQDITILGKRFHRTAVREPRPHR